ncbi:MAG TPA: hypothetical protein PKZ32_22000, partial [Candidatus Melainabacteria bacterium]|nr:hypothetical protein [Candidatus Melainabacteria bacterium]
FLGCSALGGTYWEPKICRGVNLHIADLSAPDTTLSHRLKLPWRSLWTEEDLCVFRENWLELHHL